MRVSGFNNLMLNIGKGSAQYGVRVGFNAANYRKSDGQLRFISNRGYDNVIAYSARRALAQETFANLSNLYPSIVKKKEKEHMRQAYDKYQKKNLENAVNNGSTPSDNFKKALGIVWKYRGKSADEGMLLWIKNTTGNPQPVTIRTYWDKIKGLSYSSAEAAAIGQKNSVTLEVPGDPVLMDMTAMVQMRSSKNLVLTKVQGRDCSRKELISNGDMEFTVNGKIVSEYPDVYPYEEVSKLVTLMQYKGVLQVYGLLFQQLNVTQVLVRDFRLNQNVGCKNVQPYSFTCVAVEPDYETEVVTDTLEDLNLSIVRKEKSGWAKILDGVKKSAVNGAFNTLEILTSQII